MARTKKTAEPATVRDIRDWALAQGLDVAARGRLKAEVVEAFTKATGRPLVSA